MCAVIHLVLTGSSTFCLCCEKDIHDARKTSFYTEIGLEKRIYGRKKSDMPAGTRELQPNKLPVSLVKIRCNLRCGKSGRDFE